MTTFEGIIPALVTPLDEDGELLEDGLRQVLDFTIDRGVHGVFVLGSSGEIYGLDAAQKRRVVPARELRRRARRPSRSAPAGAQRSARRTAPHGATACAQRTIRMSGSCGQRGSTCRVPSATKPSFA